MSAGGDTTVKESTPPNTSFLNPSAAVLANMFGIEVGVGEGGLQYTGLSGGQEYSPYGWTPGTAGGSWFGDATEPGGAFMLGSDMSDFLLPKGVGWRKPVGQGQWSEGPGQYFSERIFGPESFSDVADLANYENLGAEGARGVMGNWADYLSGTVQPTLEEGISTGFRTDMDPIISEAQRIYREETMPQIAQQYAGQTGSFSTDFLAANSRAGGAMGSQLGALQAQMDEAASNRRTQMLSMAGMPQELASLGLGTGSQFELMATPGGQQATLLQMLAGLQPTAAVSRGNYSQEAGASQNLGIGGAGGGK